MPTNAEHELNIFLSYGHPEAAICQKIVQKLEERGHRVWFDQDEIHHGENWRRRIEAGIEKSQAVVSCLSKHSVRDPGVCLDELSIAVGVKGGNIFTVLLGPEREVTPPASVCHLQWLDMSDWEKKKKEPGLDTWFDAKMNQLIERIESPESVRFAGEIEELKKRLMVDYSTSKQRSLLRQVFVGREWLVDKIRAWLDDPKGAPLCVLYGDPGVGKSAFAARYTHYNQSVAASLFLEYNQPHYRDARSVIMTLAYLLACRILDFRKALIWALDGLELYKLNDSELFDRLIVEPANKCIDGNRETMCIVIDGLDESSGGERNALAEVLSDKYVRRLPRWLRILVTSRKVAEVQAPLEGAYQLTLHGTDECNRADIRAYFKEMLGEKFGNDPAWPQALDALVERSDGIFLYAQLMVNGMQDDKMGIGDITQFPRGLSAAFHSWFTWFFPDYEEYKSRYRLPLGMILASAEPLPKEELQKVLGWSDAERDDFLRRIKVLLTWEQDDFGQDALRFSHQYLTEWLSADAKTQVYAVSIRDAIARMAIAFYERFKKDPEALTYYEALHLPDYLRQSGQNECAHEVELNRDVLWRIIAAGDHCNIWDKLDRAMVYYEQSQAMANVINDTEDFRRDLSVILERIADIKGRQGNPQYALYLCENALEFREQLAQEQNTEKARSELAVSYDSVAEYNKMLGDYSVALLRYEDALTIRKSLYQEKKTLEGALELSSNYSSIANIKRIQGDVSDALQLYEIALQLCRFAAEGIHTVAVQERLCSAYEDIAFIKKMKNHPIEILIYGPGYLKQPQRDIPGALNLLEKSLSIRRKLADEVRTPATRRALSYTYEMIADIKHIQKDENGARLLYENALAIREQLIQKCGTLADYDSLRRSYANIADIMKSQKDRKGAYNYYQKSIAICEQLESESSRIDDSLYYAYVLVAILDMPYLLFKERLHYAKEGLRIAKKLRAMTSTKSVHILSRSLQLLSVLSFAVHIPRFK